MKCPFCTESIHPNAKFCPKCGLPLKDDATVMGGAYVSDESSVNWPAIAAGAGGLAVIALIIGWLTGQNTNKNADQVRRDTVRMAPATGASGLRTPGVPTGNGGYASFASVPTHTFQPYRSAPTADYRPNVRWAWQPPVLPAVGGNPAPVQDWEYVPAPPANMGVLQTLINSDNRQRPPQVLASVPITAQAPAIPDWLAANGQPAAFYDPTISGEQAVRTDVEGGPFAKQAPVENPRGAYVYDAYQDRWVPNPDRPRRSGSGAPRGPQGQGPQGYNGTGGSVPSGL